MQDALSNLYNVVISFVEESVFDLEQRFIDRSDIRVAIPSHILDLIYKSRFTEDVGYKAEIAGVLIHPTWENVITVYCMDYLRTRRLELPIHRLSFDLTTDSNDGGVNRAVLDTANFFKYKV